MFTIKYETPVAELLAASGVKFESVLVGNACPVFCDDAKQSKGMDEVNTYPRRSHIHGKHYRATFTRAGKTFSTDFWNSYNDEEYNYYVGNLWRLEGPKWDAHKAEKRRRQFMRTTQGGSIRKTPTAYDVLSCIQKTNPGTFGDFCADYGYDTDSRSAESIYRACCDEYNKVRTFFTASELEALQELAQ